MEQIEWICRANKNSKNQIIWKCDSKIQIKEGFENDNNIVHVCTPPFITKWGRGSPSPFDNSLRVYKNICSYVDKTTGIGIDSSNISKTLQISKITPVSIAVSQKTAEEFAASPETQKQILERLGSFPDLQKKMP